MRCLIALLTAAAVLSTSGVSSAAARPGAGRTPSSSSAQSSAQSSSAQSSARLTASAAVSVTKRIVVRPVRADGRPARGFTVTRESIPDFTCDGGASTVAVNPNIRFCGFSATYTMACWRSAMHTVLCLRDPARKQLVRIRYTGSFTPVAAPTRPAPQALRLGNAAYCLIRDGGAWTFPVRHPSWVGYYSCTKGAVYGPPTADGIDRSHPLWRVYTVAASGKGPVSRRRVFTAYFVGTAH